MLQKFLGVLKVVLINIYFSNITSALTFINVWLKLKQNSKCWYWMKIEKSSEYKFLIVLTICQKDLLDIIVNDTKENLEFCSHFSRSPWVMLFSYSLNNDS